MRYKSFLAAVAWLWVGCGAVRAQQDDEGFAFREPLYLSEIDREMRTPQAVRVGGVVFVSAMSGPGRTVSDQLRTTYMRLQSVLGNYGLSMADVAQERIYVKEGEPLDGFPERRILVYGEETAPASTVVRVSGFDQEGVLVTVELIAVAGPEE